MITELALKLAPLEDKVYQAELVADLAFVNMKLKNYEKAIKLARDCVELNPKGAKVIKE